jgi:hypothetical protein
MKINIPLAIETIKGIIKAKLVPFLVGSPGIGKSALVRDIAKEFNLKLIDVRLSQYDTTDINGFPTINGKKAGYIPMETFPIEGDTVPEGYDGWLIFLDELNSAPQAVIAAAYQLVLDRKVGKNNLHNRVIVTCAGNLDSDNAITNPMGTAMQSRLVHIELASDPDSWIDWATANDIDHRITDYIKFRKGNLNMFKPDHTDMTYACERTWEFASKLLKQFDIKSRTALVALSGALSEGVAREFIVFTDIYDKLPKMANILNDPDNIDITDEPSILYALTGSIAHNATDSNLAAFMKFIKRLPAEFQVVTLREVVRRNKKLLNHPALIEWKLISADKLF